MIRSGRKEKTDMTKVPAIIIVSAVSCFVLISNFVQYFI